MYGSMGEIVVLSCFRNGQYDAESIIQALVRKSLHPTRPALEGGYRFSPVPVFFYVTDARNFMISNNEEVQEFDYAGVRERGREIYLAAVEEAEARNQSRKK